MAEKITEPRAYFAGDYAELSCENAKFYYGYEVEDEEGRWCFTADIKGVDGTITIPFSKLGVRDMFDVPTCLTVGIGWVLTRYKIGV